MAGREIERILGPECMHWALLYQSRYAATNFNYVPARIVMVVKWLLPDRIFDKIVSTT